VKKISCCSRYDVGQWYENELADILRVRKLHVVRERLNGIQEVRSSILLVSTKEKNQVVVNSTTIFIIDPLLNLCYKKVYLIGINMIIKERAFVIMRMEFGHGLKENILSGKFHKI